MKKLVVLLVFVLAVGLISAYMLSEYSDMQVRLSTSYAEKEDPDAVTDKHGTGNESLKVEFSQQKTFYDKDIDVELSCADGKAVIYYTTDGNTPTETSAVYSDVIRLTAQRVEKCTTIKAVAVRGENKSDVFVKSYIVGRNIYERFDPNMLVFVLSADEDDLYDYYNGIAVEGYLRDEYIRNEYDGGEINPTAPANYNIRGRESERPMYVEAFSGSGTEILSQAVGARVVGGYSRAVDQKSWRLFARKMYDSDSGKFSYPLFNDNTDGFGNFITRYDVITLRNGANDREFAGVRDELTAVLANDAGFPDTQAVRPAAVYLNGDYYGFSWLHEGFSDDYLEMMYGGDKNNYRIIGNKELEAESENEEDQKALSDWKKVVELAEGGLTDEARFEQLRELVDMDNLLRYYAMQIYIDNKDWPGNNFKVWRYYPSVGEDTDNSYRDGKWRFMLFDAEYAWGLYGRGYRDDTLKAVLTGNHLQGSSHILAALLERDDMKRAFAATLCELEAGAFSEENIKNRLDELISESDAEQMYALDNGYTSEWANRWTFSDSRGQIYDFAANRKKILDRFLRKDLDLGEDIYNVKLTAPSGSEIRLGSMTVEAGESVSVDYFAECEPTVSAITYSGCRFGYWTVNGNRENSETIIIDRSLADAEGNIVIELYTEAVETVGTVAVTRLETSGDADSFEITNTTDENVDLSGWHLSDKATKLDKYVIPSIIIQSGESLTLVLKDNKDSSSLAKHQTNFGLKTGETLYFSDRELNIISAVPVLDLEKGKCLVLGDDGKYHIK